MPRRRSEVGEGTDDSINGVYGLIRDLLVEGKDARFVKGSPGRYVLNWSRALDRYADYKARKNPHFKSKNLTRRKASNGLRAALLNFYKNEGAKEYKESKKVNDKDEVVERQFQMPPRLFESLFRNTVPSSGESGQSEQEDEREINSSISEGEIDAHWQGTPNSSDHGFDETMDLSCCDLSGSADPDSLTSPNNLLTSLNVDGFKTEEEVTILSRDMHAQMFDTSAVDSALDGICSDGISDEIAKDLDLLGVLQDICPSSGSVKGGYRFYISLTEPLSEEDSSGMAEFDGIATATVPVQKLNPYTLSGSVPPSDQPGDVPVTVTTQSGQRLGMTCFQYVDDMREMAQQLVHDPAKQALWFAILCQEYGFFGTDSDLSRVLDPLNIEYQDSSVETKQQHSVKVLQLLVYTAAQTNAKEFVEMIFSTSAGRIVFDSYKDRTLLPEDVARANGHDECAQYLHQLTKRLSQQTEFEDRPKTINWLELVKAVQNQTSVSSDTESKRPLTPVEKGDYSSDYFADAETSSFGSTEPDDMCPSHSEEGLFSHSYTLCFKFPYYFSDGPRSRERCGDISTASSHIPVYHPTAFESRLFEGPGICQDNNSRSSRRSSSDRYFTNIWSAVGLLALVVVLILVVWLGRDLGVSTYRDTVNTGCNVSSTFEIIISFVPSNDKVVIDSFITLLTTRKRYQPCAARQFYIQNDTCIDKTIHENFEPEADHSHQCHAHQLHGNHLFQKPLSHGSPHRLFTGIALLSALLFLCISLTRLFYVISHMKGRYQSPSPLGSREETSKPLEDASMKELQMERVRAWLCDNDDSKAFVSARYSGASDTLASH